MGKYYLVRQSWWIFFKTFKAFHIYSFSIYSTNFYKSLLLVNSLFVCLFLRTVVLRVGHHPCGPQNTFRGSAREKSFFIITKTSFVFHTVLTFAMVIKAMESKTSGILTLIKTVALNWRVVTTVFRVKKKSYFLLKVSWLKQYNLLILSTRPLSKHFSTILCEKMGSIHKIFLPYIEVWRLSWGWIVGWTTGFFCNKYHFFPERATIQDYDCSDLSIWWVFHWKY